jgi:arylsulfatase A-like enzyme
MLTGVWADKHGVLGNDFSANDYAAYPDFLTRLEQHNPDFETYAVLDWLPLGAEADGGPLLSPAVDSIVAFDGYIDGYAAADARSAALAADYLRTQDPDVAFVYFGNIDVVGHDTHSLSPDYRAAIEEADAHVGLLLGALRDRPRYDSEDWLVLMSTDHGRRDDGGHGEPSLQEQTIFYLASGPGAAKGTPAAPPHIVDVAVTALTYLGVPIALEWNLDGQAVGLATP